MFRREVAQLMEVVEDVPYTYRRHDVIPRWQAAGRLISYLWSLEKMHVPEHLANAWSERKKSVRAVAEAYRQKHGSDEEKRCWAEAKKHFKKLPSKR